MPELPEVETVKNALSKVVVGAKVTNVFTGENEELRSKVDSSESQPYHHSA